MIILIGFLIITPIFFLKIFYPKKIDADEAKIIEEEIGDLKKERRYIVLVQEIKKYQVAYQFIQFVTIAQIVLAFLSVVQTKIYFLLMLIPIIWGIRMLLVDHLILKNIRHIRCLTCQFAFYRDEKLNTGFFHPHYFSCDKCGSKYIKEL